MQGVCKVLSSYKFHNNLKTLKSSPKHMRVEKVSTSTSYMLVNFLSVSHFKPAAYESYWQS